MSRARAIAVLGCTSDAGKSLLATAFCRWFARRGVDVVPFKAQNMSNNARVVDGGEVGVAQWLQARAAGVEPDVRMNPVLVKPEADTRSQVVVRGRVDVALGAVPWEERHDGLWAAMSASYDELASAHELIVIEGAGSPAEINLRDQVNNRMVEHADAAAVLVADIDRGGAFAHLYGTWSLVPESTRSRLRGFVLNKFRGDAGLLAPGPDRITDLTGMAMLGVVPMLDHRLPAEEGARAEDGPADAPMVVLPRFPFGSNLDEFHALPTVARVRWATGPAVFDSLDPRRDLVILPGSKHVVADLAWMHDRGLAGAVRRAADRGVRVFGVCGGAMMLGRAIADPGGVEGGTPSDVSGLALLDLSTRIGASKTVGRAAVRFGALAEPFASLSGREVDGYEIRFGDVSGGPSAAASAGGGPVAWRSGNVLATTVHGLFEDPAVVEAVVGRRPASVLEDAFEQLADAVDEHLDAAFLASLANR